MLDSALSQSRYTLSFDSYRIVSIFWQRGQDILSARIKGVTTEIYVQTGIRAKTVNMTQKTEPRCQNQHCIVRETT
jgi:hypothetical protein